MNHPIEIVVNHGVVRGLETGSGRSRKILAVHGWLDNASSFIPIAPLIEDAHMVAVDLAGHGHSDHRPPGTSYHLVDYVPDVVEVAERLAWDRFILLGHSLGAGIASLIAATFPERVEKLCLVDGIGPMSGADSSCPERLRRSIVKRRLQGYRHSVHASVESALEARLRVTRMDPACARLIVERNLVAVDGGYAWRTDRRVTHASPVYLAESQVRAFLRAIEAPTLLVRAANGVIVDRDSTAERIGCLSRVKVVDMAGDHHLHMDAPEPVAKVINSFLGE